MSELILRLAEAVRDAIASRGSQVGSRYVRGTALGGDAEFPVDVLAEDAVWRFLKDEGMPIAVYTESAGLRVLGHRPEFVLIVDPIDGTRGAAANLEMACISIAAARFSELATIADIEFAMLKEVKTGAWMYADENMPGLLASGYEGRVPALSPTVDLDRMFWSIEFNGHPADLMIAT